MKKLLLALLATALALTGAAHASDLEIPTLIDDTYIYDQDSVFTESTKSEVNTKLINLQSETGVDFAVITIHSLDGRDSSEYATTLANKLGIGSAENDTGILMLISKSDSRVYIAVGKGLEGILNDAKVGRILDEHFVPYRPDNYDTALTQTTTAIIDIALDHRTEIANGTAGAQPPTAAEIIIGAIAVLAFLAFIIFIVAKSKPKNMPWILWLLSSNNRRRGGRSSGGFGGFGGGGGGHSIGGGGSFGGGGAGR